MKESDTYFFEAKGIKKAFGGTQALKSAQLQVKKGEVLALLGENGAGKSTLMKIIIGLERADAGEMFIDGKPYIARGPIEAMHAGISMIHQELNTEPYLTVAENIFLNREDTKGIFLDKKETVRKTKKLMEDFGFSIHPETEMGKLSIAEAQMVEIIKAASCNAKMVIMDEPTSSLDNAETERLFKIIADLKSKGVSIIYISHRLEEIYKIADRAAVFRDGEYITTQEIEGLSQSQIISYMVGHEVKDLYPKVEADIGDVVLEVKNLSGKGFTDISFKVRKGEILGFSGLVGAGRSETMRAIFGLDPIKSGEIFLEGKKIKIDSTAKAIDYGIAMANEDRKTYGLCLFRSLKENIALPTLRQFQKGLLINHKKENTLTTDIAKKLKVKALSLENTAYSLSGGNQQKVVLCKWMLANPKVLIIDEPTRGIDVGAKAEIHRFISECAADGMAVLMVSSELDELIGMSDRIIVYHEGHISGEVDRAEILSQKVIKDDILAMAFGRNVGGDNDRQ